LAPGNTLDSVSVQIATNYVPGEDQLTFTPAGNITGQFFPDSGLLLLTGGDTLADYQQVLRSVQYQNVNPVPYTAARLIEVVLDDGSGSGNPAVVDRTVTPEFDGGGPVQTAGTVNPLTILPGAPTTSLGLTDLAFAPVPGVTELIYTITDLPAEQQGQVLLTDGTEAAVGMQVPLGQLTGAVFAPAAAPRAQSGDFTFTVAGMNPITGAADPNPLTVTVPVTTENVAPVAVNDTASTALNTPVAIDVVANDTDANGDNLLIVGFSAPAHGTVAYSADNTQLVYTPNQNFSGTDSFTYDLDDEKGGTATGTVSVTVAPPPPTPTPAPTPTPVFFPVPFFFPILPLPLLLALRPTPLVPVLSAALQRDPAARGRLALVVTPPAAGRSQVVLTAARDGQSLTVEIRQLQGGRFHLLHRFATRDVSRIVIFGDRTRDRIRVVGVLRLRVAFVR
jgi:hypothetical protein